MTQQLHFHLHLLLLENKSSLQTDILQVSVTYNITQIIALTIIHILPLLTHSGRKLYLLELGSNQDLLFVVNKEMYC